jgi:hypothetical protein
VLQVTCRAALAGTANHFLWQQKKRENNPPYILKGSPITVKYLSTGIASEKDQMDMFLFITT